VHSRKLKAQWQMSPAVALTGMATQEDFDTLCFYTLAHGGNSFIHQHVVDAYGAQTADANTKPIRLFFSLAGLYLYLEKNYTGWQVQQAHLQMTKKQKYYPAIDLPETKGEVTVNHVVQSLPGIDRDEMIRNWCRSVWTAYSSAHTQVKALVEELLSV
jgi:hypothetical protein